MIIVSIQIGQVRSEGDPASGDPMSRRWTSSFRKESISGPVTVTRLGITGDSVADTCNHGGADKAVLCYAASHYRPWSAEHPDLPFSPGAFGENLTVDGLDESSVCIGDCYRIGDLLLEVSQPRQPCWKIARRWQCKTLTKEVTQTGRTGWYARVLNEAEISAGDAIQRETRPQPNWPIQRVNDLMYGRLLDRAALMELMSLPELADAWKKEIA